MNSNKYVNFSTEMIQKWNRHGKEGTAEGSGDIKNDIDLREYESFHSTSAIKFFLKKKA